MKGNKMIQLAWTAGLAGLVLTAVAPQAWAQPARNEPSVQAKKMAQTGQLSGKDYDFLVRAARIDMDEVQAGQLAQSRGTSQAVREFGAHMINDHTKANTGLKEIGTQKNAALPTQLSQEQNSKLQHLQGLSGAEFDKTYAQEMVKGHTQAVKEFEAAAKNLSDTDLRAWAQTALPLFQEHLNMAKNMEAALKNET
ncbi:MAG: hypothetical protein JWR26_1862 [Pedosphaera sp.]|nr:hypothetical protein [Pedosphaera sp.]